MSVGLKTGVVGGKQYGFMVNFVELNSILLFYSLFSVSSLILRLCTLFDQTPTFTFAYFLFILLFFILESIHELQLSIPSPTSVNSKTPV